jgi:hypothetical protein
MTVEWTPREGSPLVWDATINARSKASIVGGIQVFEGKKRLEIETYGCWVNDKSVGQRGSLETAKEWCVVIAENLAPDHSAIAEMHLWSIVPYGPHKRIVGFVYGDARFGQGVGITTENIVKMDWDPGGDLVTAADGFQYRLCGQDRTAELIVKGYAREAREPYDDD